MFHPTRGGVRGGKDQFTWESVKTDKDRECYLGHSIMAPIGRWQEGKDLHWYNKEGDKKKVEKRINEEFMSAKEMEEKALMAALGYKVVDKPKQAESSQSDHEEEKRRKRHKSPERRKRNKSSSDEKEEEDVSKKVKGPQIFDLGDEKDIDEMLLKLVDKYGFDKVYDALIEDDEHKSKKKKKHKKHKSKKSKKRKENSNESEEENAKYVKDKGSHKNKKSHRKSSPENESKSSSSSDSD
jgi:Multiple myeloma tumor-associated